MANDTVKLELQGDIQLDVFAEATKHFSELVIALSKDIAGQGAIEWGLDTLHYGSPAVMMWQGHADNTNILESVVVAVEEVGQSLETGRAVPYGEHIRKIAVEIARIPNGKITTLLLGSKTYTAHITSESFSRMGAKVFPDEISSYGQVVGYADTLSRRGLTVTIFDELFEKAVLCHFEPGEEAQMRDMWTNRRVAVFGYVTRDAVSGRPRAIRDIRKVEYLPEPNPESFSLSRGVIPFQVGDELPEHIVRRLRDAN